MKVFYESEIPEQMDLEELSQALQLGIARIDELNIKHVPGCNFYFTPINFSGKEIGVVDDENKRVDEIHGR